MPRAPSHLEAPVGHTTDITGATATAGTVGATATEPATAAAGIMIAASTATDPERAAWILASSGTAPILHPAATGGPSVIRNPVGSVDSTPRPTGAMIRATRVPRTTTTADDSTLI